MIDWLIIGAGLALLIGVAWLIRWMFAGRDDDGNEVDAAIEAAKRHRAPDPRQAEEESLQAAAQWLADPMARRNTTSQIDPEQLVGVFNVAAERRESFREAQALIVEIADGHIPTLAEVETLHGHFSNQYVADAMVIGMWTSVLRQVRDMAPCPPLVVDDAEPRQFERIVIAAERNG